MITNYSIEHTFNYQLLFYNYSGDPACQAYTNRLVLCSHSRHSTPGALFSESTYIEYML